MLRARVKTDLRRTEKLRRDIITRQGPVKATQDDCANLYRAFLVKRFTVFSLGGGTWPPIKRSTAKKKGHSRILQDTRFLRLKLREIIQVIRITSRSMIFALRSTMRHPKAGMPLADLAEIHNQGLGNNPKREILVEPDRETLDQMKDAGKGNFIKALR